MIINVFGEIINPDNIRYLTNDEDGTKIWFSDEDYVHIKGKTNIEVGKDINRLLLP